MDGINTKLDSLSEMSKSEKRKRQEGSEERKEKKGRLKEERVTDRDARQSV